MQTPQIRQQLFNTLPTNTMTYLAMYDDLYFSAREAWLTSTDFASMFNRIRGGMSSNESDWDCDAAEGGDFFHPYRKHFDHDELNKLEQSAATTTTKHRGFLHYRGKGRGKPFGVPILSAFLALILLAGTILTMPPSTAAQPTPRRVLLSDIQTLTLSTHSQQMTTGRRSTPIPQATCVGGTAHGRYTPATIQCTNKGWDGVDAQWECRADLDNAFRFGATTVVCEGYDYPDDPYILAGSCGVEYTLELTQEGRDARGNVATPRTRGGAGYHHGSSHDRPNRHLAPHYDHDYDSYGSNVVGNVVRSGGYYGYYDEGAPPLDSRWDAYSNRRHHHHHHHRNTYDPNPTCWHHHTPHHTPSYDCTGYNDCGSSRNGYYNSDGYGLQW